MNRTPTSQPPTSQRRPRSHLHNDENQTTVASPKPLQFVEYSPSAKDGRSKGLRWAQTRTRVPGDHVTPTPRTPLRQLAPALSLGNNEHVMITPRTRISADPVTPSPRTPLRQLAPALSLGNSQNVMITPPSTSTSITQQAHPEIGPQRPTKQGPRFRIRYNPIARNQNHGTPATSTRAQRNRNHQAHVTDSVMQLATPPATQDTLAQITNVVPPTPPLTQAVEEQPRSDQPIRQDQSCPDAVDDDLEDMLNIYIDANQGIPRHESDNVIRNEDTTPMEGIVDDRDSSTLGQDSIPEPVQHVQTQSRRRTRTQRANLFLAARKPYEEPTERHDLGRMDVPCSKCHALHWIDERLSDSSLRTPRFGLCCMDGKIRLPHLGEPPEPLKHLLTSQDDSDAKSFREDIWKYNRAFSFTSLGVSEDHSINEHQRGPSVFRIFGELHHRSGALTTNPSETPRYAQLYLYEPRAALETRMFNNASLNRRVMESLQTMLEQSHSYVPIYRHAYEVLRTYNPSDDVVVRLRLTPNLDRRRYNLPTADEVAMILPGNQTAREPRDIILRLRSGPLHRISDLHPAYAPLQYPLLFSHGESGWYPEMYLTETEDQRSNRLQQRRQRQQQRRDRGVEIYEVNEVSETRQITLTRYTAYRIHFRSGQFNPLHYGGRLFTRYIVDMFASANQQRLNWILQNQSTFRAARFNNLQDAAAEDDNNLDLNELGQRVILPSSYIGGPRNMQQGFQDSMAIVRYYRKADLFITGTCNPRWPEIERELLPGQTAYDRPDLVARVFHLKKNAIIDYIYKHGIFGEAVAYVYTIEFQKRGLPHFHCLVFLKDPYKLLTPEAIDSCIRACWPDPETEPLLFETVKKCMVHGPCGPDYPNAPCMVDGKCSKGFPKEYQPHTTMDGKGYPLYFRPNDGRAYEVNGVFLDNRWIIPFCAFLCALFNCHINVECAASLGSFKYIFKYIQKGPDLASLQIDMKDEIKRFIQGFYISAPVATWRTFHYEIHEQVPNIVRLQIHLPGHHVVTFDAEADLQTILERGLLHKTTLTAFFEANADRGALGHEARKYTYQEFPQHFVYNANMRKWKLRERGFALGRMYFIKPTAGEQFYLRTLLTVVKGPESFEDLRRVPGYNNSEPLPTYHAACLARGLLEDDGEWRLCLEEACEMQTGTRLRHLFVTLLLFAEPAEPNVLWQEFRGQICDDLGWRLQAMGISNRTDDDIYDYGLFLLDKLLADSGHSLVDFPSMPRPQRDWSAFSTNSLIAEQLNYNRNVERANLDLRLPNLNRDQRTAYTKIVDAIENCDAKLFFLNGPGGTGKTYVYNTICAKIRSEGYIILCVSSSGISALLIQGGRTAHSMFKIPIDTLSETSVCSIPKNSQRGELLRAARAVIWDEVGAQHRYAIEAVDRTFRDIRNDNRPFGGIPVILGGDFLQTLPVVPKGSREDIINATIQHSYLWEHVEVLFLRQNMRLQQGIADVAQFSRWLLDVGHGRNMINDSDNQIKLLPNMRVDNIDSLINAIYPSVDSDPPPSSDYFMNRMILAPRNVDVGDMNERILGQMAGDTQQYISADQVVHENGADQDSSSLPDIPVEFLRSVNTSSIPPGELNLKIGCPVILLRNLSPSLGLCNGTRMIITRMQTRVLEVQLLGGEHDGEIALIPRITLTPSNKDTELTFRFKRRQFPIRLAFALSINKSQGQSVKYIGLDLQIPVFAHGQLYVALSRATSSQNIKVLLPENQTAPITSNVVYEEVLLN